MSKSQFTAHRIEMRCGHTADVSLYGTAEEQRYELKRLSEAECRECWIARKDQRDAMECSDVEKEHPELAPIMGSAKQVKWARLIRAHAIPIIESVIAEAIRQLAAQAPAAPEKYEALARSHIDYGVWVFGQAEAKFWIQQREHFASEEAVHDHMMRRVYVDLVRDLAKSRRKGAGA